MTRRTVEGICTTLAVGSVMAGNFVRVLSKSEELGDKLAPEAQKYIGFLGSEVVRWGVPLLLTATIAYIGIVAIRATDNYFLKR